MISLLGKMGHQAFLGQSEELKHSTIKSWLLFMYLRPDLILNTNLSDIVRKKAALAGWLEVLPLARSHDENFKFLRKEDDKGQVVLSSNPATIEFEVVHTSLLPGLLNTKQCIFQPDFNKPSGFKHYGGRSRLILNGSHRSHSLRIVFAILTFTPDGTPSRIFKPESTRPCFHPPTSNPTVSDQFTQSRLTTTIYRNSSTLAFLAMADIPQKAVPHLSNDNIKSILKSPKFMKPHRLSPCNDSVPLMWHTSLDRVSKPNISYSMCRQKNKVTLPSFHKTGRASSPT
ncbi:hypothetical protein MJO28_002885 [Puccinia striiformis f. sp. tritici]|uniref:Uncharacterized protein n=1 Tax=Puccinia striiformis f. sp. tritici TaxID=168172 RepID=A0ACC0ERY8_9BASI|nr:hypothetical protein MJO28_002885 [Puccinia striiformis f. sp. tritici]